MNMLSKAMPYLMCCSFAANSLMCSSPTDVHTHHQEIVSSMVESALQHSVVEGRGRSLQEIVKSSRLPQQMSQVIFTAPELRLSAPETPKRSYGPQIYYPSHYANC